MAGQLHTVLCDGYDRDVLERLLRRNSGLREALARAERLLPHADALVCDLFAALFKLNVVVLPADELSAAVLLNRRLVSSVAGSADLDALRAQTQLDPEACAAALPSLLDRILIATAREFRIGPEELLDAAAAAHDEDELARRRDELAHLSTLPDEALGEDEKAALARDLADDIDDLEDRIADARARQESLAERVTSELDDSVALKVSVLPQQLSEADEQLRSLGLGQGQPGRVGADRRLELGERLLKSRKLQLLAKLVGAFREVAFEARRRRVVRAPQELHAVCAGSHLDRMLPSELLGLRRDAGPLHSEFLRRLAEGQLLEYELHGASQRGPIVVCVDGSGSMQGSKELWSKAVALTLMEIARREKRRCLGIVFSSGTQLFEVEFLGGAGRARARADVLDDNVLAFAEHFPGGGTDFEAPLSRAVDAVCAGDYRRGDIVFITDGQAHVSDALVRDIAARRRRHRFRIRGIVVDVADSTAATLDRFCDDVRQVTDLAADSLSELFAGV